MYSKKALIKSGVTQEKLKSLSENMDANPDFKRLIERVAARIQDGVDRNLSDYKLWWALEKAYDAPFYQTSSTLLKDIVEGGYDQEKVNSLLNDWGMTHMLTPLTNADGTCQKGADGKEKKALNVPIFTQVFVPLCLAYHTIRWAKLFNDRNLTPLYKYDPSYSTKENRLKCDIWTSRIAAMSNQYGYVNDEKQAIFQALHYGTCLKFIRESWHTEQQSNDEGKDVIVKEGLRFHMPTPDRFYYDLNERLSTLNSDSGTAFLGYWQINRYQDVNGNPDFWNKGKISFGANADIIGKSPNFFATVYPCAITFPRALTGDPSNVAGEGNDRERASAYYTDNENDNAVLLTTHFEKIIPKDHGIGAYAHPVWFRFVMANKNVPIYIEPIYCPPASYYGYDADANRRLASSLTLELLPWQDQMSNAISQWISSVRQNLTNVVFVDTDVVSSEAILKMKNLGEKNLKGISFLEFSSHDIKAMSGEIREAFHTPQIPRNNTAELQSLMTGILNLLERTLQFSPQETGQAASHEQSATESTIVANHIGNRVKFTGSFIDDGIWATKKMLYYSTVANGDDNIFAEIAPSYSNTVEEFKTLAKSVGVEVEDIEDNSPLGRVKVSANKKSILVEAFATTRDGEERPNNPGIAAAASQVLNSIAGNPILMQSVGPEQVIELVNNIVSIMGLPKDFRLKFQPMQQPMGPGAEQQQAQIGQIVGQVQEQIKTLAEQVAQRIQQGEAQVGQAIQASGQQIMQASVEASGQQLQQVVMPIVDKLKQLDQAVAQGQAVLAQIAQANQPIIPPVA